jgi:hypothetical protein
MKPYIRLAGLLLVLPWIVAGCGGGGGSSSGSGTMGVFVTDSPDTENDHVWATLLKVELVKSDGSAEVVFDDANGKTVDLKSLRDSSGHRFLFLGEAHPSAGTYAKVRVTIDDMLTLFPNGASSGQQIPVADSLPRDAQGNVQVEFDLPQPKQVGPGAHEIVVDFDLANFHLNGAGKIVPVCKEGDGSSLPNPERHEHEEYTGLIADLAGEAPSQEFKLMLANGNSFPVATSEKTAIFNADGSPSPMLANGKRVKVRGIFDVTARRLNATEIKIKKSEDEPHDGPAAVAGTVHSIDSAHGAFKIMPGRAEGFVPTEIKVRITTSAETHFWSASGVAMTKEEFFSIISSVKEAAARGVYDAATNTIAASEVKILSLYDQSLPKSVYARGVVAEMNAEAGTVRMSPVVQWEGFVPAENSVNIVTNGETLYKDASSNLIDKATFFESMHVGNGMKVEGTIDGGVITAKVMRRVL